MARIFQAGAVIPFQNYILELNMPVREERHHTTPCGNRNNSLGARLAPQTGASFALSTPLAPDYLFFLKQRDTVIYIPSLIPLMSQRVFTKVSQAFEMLAKYSQAFLNSYFCIVMFCSQSPTHLFGLLQSC